MSKIAITDTYLTNIANAIRTKSESSDTYTPSEMASAILNIKSSSGAYKVNSIEEMNNLTDMSDGDYCIIDDYTEYTIPTNATFTKFTDEPSKILNNEYLHHLFLIKPRWANSELNIFFNTEKYMNYTGTATLYSVGNTNIPKSNGVHTTNPNENPHYVFTFEKYDGQIYLKTLANNYITTIYTNYLKNQTTRGFYLKNITKNSNNYYKFQISAGDKYLQAYSYDGSIIQMRNNASGTEFDIYVCPMNEIVTDYLVYQYDENDGWVDVTDEILVPTTTVTPTTQQQTIPIPDGYRGLKEVTVSAVTSSIDANIQASNIRKYVNILGVTGILEEGGGVEGLYKLSSVSEMNAIQNPQTGDVCVIYDENNNKVLGLYQYGGYEWDSIIPYYEDLPSTYTAVNYLKSNGNQYIDTGVKPYKTRTKIKFSLNDTTSVGYLSAAYSLQGRYYVLNTNESTSGKITVPDKDLNLIYQETTNTNIHTIDYNNNNRCYYDNVDVGAIPNLSSQGTANIYLFARRGSSQAELKIKAKIYYAKIWENGTLVRDMIPCLRNSDNVAGMYDLVNNTFYSGSGTFTYGY